MTITAGIRLGPYEIVAAIGAGGMGEVYRATDMNLGRQVAIKVLPETFAQDADRLARFEREAKTLAALNHPNIAQIYGLERSGTTPALVMELVEGETLADRIAHGAIPIDEALPIANQIAVALEAAHEQGIIHRDLKPANIKVRSDGTVKVLDFGLAKLNDATAPNVPNALSLSPTITSPALMTGVGLLLGTAAYMAPEQARGRPIGKRSDVWALGCVLYEMLAGTRAFSGEDVAETLAHVISREPDWSALPKLVPPSVVVLLQRCLEKDPRRRVADAAAVLFALDYAGRERHTAAVPVSGRRPTWRSVAMLSALAFVPAALVGAVMWYTTRPEPPRLVRSQIVTAGPTALAMQGNDVDLAITPDGSHIVYRGTNQLVVRALDQLKPRVLTGLAAPRAPFISPDGQWIGFLDGAGFLKKVAITGGPPVTIAKTDGTGPRGVSWGADGSIVFATADDKTGLLRVSDNGGEITVLTRPNRASGEVDHRWPELLPGGRAVLFTIYPGDPTNAQVAVLDLSTGKYSVVLRGYGAHYVRTGHLVYGASSALRAVAFDLNRLQVVGTPVPVNERMMVIGYGALNAAVSTDGTLVYVPAPNGPEGGRSLVWVSREGREESIPAPPRAYDSLLLSPDGTRAVIQSADEENDIWVWDFARRTFTRLTFAPQVDYDPVWTPDGSRIVFSRGGALFARAADGTGTEQQLATGTMTATSFTPDGSQLVVMQGNDLLKLSLKGKVEKLPLVNTTFAEQRGYLSPDGRWLAYQSNESGQDQIYVQPFPDVSGGRWQVSPRGGAEPAWSRDGRELFFIDGSGALVTVPVETRSAFSAGNPVKLFDVPYFAVTGTRRYDVTADGKRFLFIKNGTDASGMSSPSLVVVQHWTDSLTRPAAAN